MKDVYAHVRLLMVDDLPSDRQLIKYALEEIGFAGAIDFERSGQALIDGYLQSTTPPPLPDLILLDVNLSDMKGQDLLRLIKQDERTCTIPVVILSSSHAPETAAQCYSLGAGGYVVKPTDFDQLKIRLENILDFWMQAAVKRNGSNRAPQ